MAGWLIGKRAGKTPSAGQAQNGREAAKNIALFGRQMSLQSGMSFINKQLAKYTALAAKVRAEAVTFRLFEVLEVNGRART